MVTCKIKTDFKYKDIYSVTIRINYYHNGKTAYNVSVRERKESDGHQQRYFYTIVKPSKEFRIELIEEAERLIRGKLDDLL